MAICWIIAGPNGAGKTTFAKNYLPDVANCLNFVNADSIAAGLSPLDPRQKQMAASRIFLNEIYENIDGGRDFAFETTLSGRMYMSLIQRLMQAGWTVELVYLALPDWRMSQQRVAERVAHGGHDIPLTDIQRRFPRSLSGLFQSYAGLVSRTRCFMNHEEKPVLVFEQCGDQRDIYHDRYFQHLFQEAGL